MGCGVHVALLTGSLVRLLCCIEEPVERNCIVQWGQRSRGEELLLVFQDDVTSPRSVNHKKM